MRAVTTVVAMVLLVIGVGVGVEAGLGVGHQRSVVARRIDQIGLNAAASVGDSHVQSVTWVKSDLASAERAISAGVTSDQPVYVLQVQGHFVAKVSTGLPDSRPSPFTVILMVLDLGLHPLIAGSSDTPLSLDRLGTPETDSLAGMTPDWGHLALRAG